MSSGGLSFATKRIGPPCCTLFTFIAYYPLQIILSQNYMLPTISVLAENTLMKTACHFLLLLVGFDTLTYRKYYDRSPILVGHQATAPSHSMTCESCASTVASPFASSSSASARCATESQRLPTLRTSPPSPMASRMWRCVRRSVGIRAWYVSVVSTFPNAFPLVLDSNLHDLNETNPD